MDFLEKPPRWAYQWCYFWAFLGMLAIVSGFMSMYNARQLGPVYSLVIFLVTLIYGATAFTMFWMCRASLRNAN